MRFVPLLTIALLPIAAAPQGDEWLRDDMSDPSLWLLRTDNLATETTISGTAPASSSDKTRWVMSRGDGPAYVVYFVPGPIREVEIDTHRMTGASGDFTLAASTDGILFQPLDTGAVQLDSTFGWDYRLMSADQIPENATHLLVRFPDGSAAHRLSEVWVRFDWDETLASRFLPPPRAAVATPAGDALAARSDAELQRMLAALMPRDIPPDPFETNPPPAPLPARPAAGPPAAPAPGVVVESPPVDDTAPSAPNDIGSTTLQHALEPEPPAGILFVQAQPDQTPGASAPESGVSLEMPADESPHVAVDMSPADTAGEAVADATEAPDAEVIATAANAGEATLVLPVFERVVIDTGPGAVVIEAPTPDALPPTTTGDETPMPAAVEEGEPDAKPALKARRFGPRSKMRRNFAF